VAAPSPSSSSAPETPPAQPGADSPPSVKCLTLPAGTPPLLSLRAIHGLRRRGLRAGALLDLPCEPGHPTRPRAPRSGRMPAARPAASVASGTVLAVRQERRVRPWSLLSSARGSLEPSTARCFFTRKNDQGLYCIRARAARPRCMRRLAGTQESPEQAPGPEQQPAGPSAARKDLQRLDTCSLFRDERGTCGELCVCARLVPAGWRRKLSARLLSCGSRVPRMPAK